MLCELIVQILDFYPGRVIIYDSVMKETRKERKVIAITRPETIALKRSNM